MCIEWLKLNDRAGYDREQASQSGALLRSHGLPMAADGAAGSSRPAERPPDTVVAKSRVPEELAAVAGDLRQLSDEMLSELEGSGLECQIGSDDFDPVWLVPNFTNDDRAELTYRGARSLLIAMSVFPNASLRSIKRKIPTKDPAEHDDKT